MSNTEKNFNKPEELLKKALGELNSEYGSLMIMGRGFTPSEEQRYEALSKARELVEEALKVLEPEKKLSDKLINF